MKLSAFLVPLAVTACAQAARLVDFQVAQPPPLPRDAKQCTVQILEYVSRCVSLSITLWIDTSLQTNICFLVWRVSSCFLFP